MILPNTKPQEYVIKPGAPTQAILPIYMALKRGIKLFGDHKFTSIIPPEHERDHDVLHMSGIGYCGRKLAFQLHHYEEYKKLEGEVSAIYLHLGNIIEDYTVHLLTLGGLPPYDTQRELRDLRGLITGHIDGLLKVQNEECLLEIKALKHSSVELLINHGLQRAVPIYYDQIQYYMFCLSLKGGFFVALDKDTSQYYTEKVAFSEERAMFLRKKALAIHGLPVLFHVPEDLVVRDCRFCCLAEKCASFEGKNHFIENFIKYEKGRP
jgi:hypothetical protein